MNRPAPIPAAEVPARLLQLREVMAWSVADAAAALGLEGANATDRLRELERGARPASGTVRQLLAYMLRDAGAAPAQPGAAPQQPTRRPLADTGPRDP